MRVYECRGAHPASSSDCYGSPASSASTRPAPPPRYPRVPPFTYPGQTDPFDATPDGPANWQDNVTHADGTGQVTIQVFTKRESAGLGCDADSPCSIVVVPNYGRNQANIGDTEDLMDAPWAWARRTVVPLSFQSVDDACSLNGSRLRVEGSPMAGGLLACLAGRTCTLEQGRGHPRLHRDRRAADPSRRGIGDDRHGAGDRPPPPRTRRPAGVVYSPVSITGLVVAFQIDDANGRPVTSMRLNARLVAKLITASYRSGGDAAVANNPVNLFRDPEFLKLNPGVAWPGGAPGNHPLLLGDLSDTTSALTRWIWHDPQARAFIKGKPDPWGMKVNANYKNVRLPFASYPLLDQVSPTASSPSGHGRPGAAAVDRPVPRAPW